MPYFSIVTPAFNREREIQRAIESCLSQDFSDFELIVVDDGSTDQTAAVVEGYSDHRVRSIRHPRNRGVCPARNTAIRAAAGPWIVYLDSDHELLPGCLSRVFQVVSTDLTGAGRIGFLYRFDGGRISPSVSVGPEVLGYEEWLRFSESAHLSDALWATRRSTFDRCSLPESFALEFKYNLDFSKVFTWRIVPEVLALQHTDSPARLSWFGQRGSQSVEQQRALDCLEDWTGVVRDHGEALRSLAPRRYQGALRGCAISSLLIGRRWDAIRAACGCVLGYPGNFVNWAALASTLAGPGVARMARRWRARRNSMMRLPARELGRWAHQQ